MEKTILLVEDEALIAMSQQMDLERYGYTVFTVNSGEKAIEFYGGAPDRIDLILMDIDLGSGIDGTETAQRILKDHDVPIVFLSGHTEPEIVAKTEKITSYGYVVKNSNITVLDASIKMALKLHEANRKIKANEIKYKSLFELESDCLALIEVETGRMLEVNQSFLDHYGYDREAVLRMKNTDFSAEPEETRKATLQERNAIPVRWHRKKDGTVFPTEITANIFELDGVRVHIAAIRDITDRLKKEKAIRDSEDKFKTVFQKSPYAIALTDGSTGRLIDVNDMYCLKTGFDKGTVIGKTTTELGFYEAEERIRFMHELAEKGFVDGLEMRFKVKDKTIHTKMFAGFIKSDGNDIIMTMFEDITKRKQQERDLIFQSMVLDQIRDNITVTDLNGTITYVNKAVEKTVGRSKTEILGKSTLVYGEDPEKGATQNEIVEKTMQKGVYRCEIVNFDADHNEHIMDCRSQIVTDDQGEPIALCGIATDVTESRLVEEKLKKEQQRFREIAELLPDVVFEFDLQMNLTFANERAFELFGYTKADFTQGINASTMVAPESQEKALGNISRLLTGERLGLQEYVAIKKDGTRFPVLIHSNQIYQDGCVTGLRGILTDITERKRFEQALEDERQRLQNIIESTNAGVWEWNVQTGEVIVNERSAGMVGYTKNELSPISINTWIEHVHPDDFVISNEQIKKHLKGESELYECEVRIRHRDGHYVWILDRGKVMSRTEDGKPLWMFGTHSDITSIKKTEEELEKALSMQTTLLSELKHRAKNSFSLISSIVGMAERNSTAEETRTTLSNIHSRIFALAEMYRLLSDTNSISEVELSHYLSNVADGLATEWVSVSVFKASEAIVLPVQTATTVGLVVAELITNAVKHAFPDNEGGTIRISLSKTDETVLLEIRDNGVGIPENVDPLKSESMGLKLVNALTYQIEGSISLNTENGTRWRLEFPLESSQ